MAHKDKSRSHRPSKKEKERESPPPPPPPKEVEEDEENESDSQSGSESDASPSDNKALPIPIPLATTSAKRGHDEMRNGKHPSSKSGKKPKSELKERNSNSCSPLVSRAWSKEDEITLLRGMVDFKNVKEVDPTSELGAFHHSIKGKFQGDYSKEQLNTKIWYLRWRFVNAMKRVKDGCNRIFFRPHQCTVFEISKKVWGDSVGNLINDSVNGVSEANAKKDSRKVKRAKKIAVMDEEEKKNGEGGSFWSKYPFFSGSFDDMSRDFPSLGLSGAAMRLMKDNLSLIGSEEARELDDKCKQFFVEEMELNDKKKALVKTHLRGL